MKQLIEVIGASPSALPKPERQCYRTRLCRSSLSPSTRVITKRLWSELQSLRRIPGLLKVAATLMSLLFIAAEGRAQSAVDGFDPGADNGIFALAVQADGKIQAGGVFNALGGGGFGTT